MFQLLLGLLLLHCATEFLNKMSKKVFIIIGAVIALAIVFVLMSMSTTSKVGGVITGIKINSHRYSVEVADTMLKQTQGLSGRESLAAGTGMLFVFNTPYNETFWMKGMLISIDIIWIREGRVIGFVEDAPTPSGASIPTFNAPGPADMVLEVPAGTVAKDSIKQGDAVQVLY